METSENKILLAGFERFGPYPYNVAERLVNELEGEIIEVSDDVRLRIVGLKLPINFGTFREVLAEGIREVEPKIVVGLGMDFKDLNCLSFEQVAHATPRYGNAIRDVKGNSGVNNPLDNMRERLRIPNEIRMMLAIVNVPKVRLSENAGSHMCETVFRDLIRRSDSGKNFQPAFIHLPHTPDLLPYSKHFDKHKKSMPLDEQVETVRRVIARVGKYVLSLGA